MLAMSYRFTELHMVEEIVTEFLPVRIKKRYIKVPFYVMVMGFIQ